MTLNSQLWTNKQKKVTRKKEVGVGAAQGGNLFTPSFITKASLALSQLGSHGRVRSRFCCPFPVWAHPLFVFSSHKFPRFCFTLQLIYNSFFCRLIFYHFWSRNIFLLTWFNTPCNWSLSQKLLSTPILIPTRLLMLIYNSF